MRTLVLVVLALVAVACGERGSGSARPEEIEAVEIPGNAPELEPPHPVLAEAERAPLERVVLDGESWLVHPTLGFRIRDPGESFEAHLAGSDGMPASAMPAPAFWVFADPTTRRALFLMLDVVRRQDEPGFVAIARGDEMGLRARGAEIDDERCTFEIGRGRCAIEAHAGPVGIAMVVHLFRGDADDRDYMVSLHGPAELRSVVESFATRDGR